MNRPTPPHTQKNVVPAPEYRMAGGDVARTVVAEIVPGRGFFGLLGVILCIILLGTVVLYFRQKDEIMRRDEYILTRQTFDAEGNFDGYSLDKIHFFQQTPDGLTEDLPPWMKYDIRHDMLELMSGYGEFETLSVLESGLVERVKSAMNAHPWVRRVTSVQKFHPARLDVVLEYRKPVMMVERRDPQTRQVVAVIPMDAEACVLAKADIPEGCLAMLPVLKNCDSGMMSTSARSFWNNVVGQEAARIAADFGDDWQKLNLYAIRPEMVEEPKNNFVHHFFLDTRTGGVVDFGPMSTNDRPYSSGHTREKIEALLDYLMQHKTLDTPDGKPLRFSATGE